MQKFYDTIINDKGRPVEGASIVVTQNGVPATIYAHDGVTVLVDLQTDADGYFEFRAADGEYTLEAYVRGVRFWRRTGVELATSNADFFGANGSALVGYIASGAGAVPRTVQDKMRERESAHDVGVSGDGVTDDLAKFQLFDEPTYKPKFIPSATYKLSADWTPPDQDISIEAGPAISFASANADYSNIVPFQAGPIWSQRLIKKTYGTNWTGGGNVFQFASYATSEAADLYTDGYNVVAIYGGADSRGAGSSVWGGNFVAYANNATAKSIGIELNCGALVNGGLAYGLVVASAGNFQPQNAVQVQANNANSQFVNGIDMRFRDGIGGITGAVYKITGSGDGLATCENLLKASTVKATAAEIDIPSFAVEATQTGTVNRVSVRGAATGGAPRISATGSDANINLEIRAKGTGVALFTNNGAENFRVKASSGTESLEAGAGTGAGTLAVRGTETNADVQVIGKGTGGVRLRSGDSTDKVRVNTTGIGFNAAAPIAKPTITGSRGGNAALASLLTQLAAYGLITDSTTA